MELVNQYIKSSRTNQVVNVVLLWNEKGINSTPEIAAFIEECGITRHHFDDKCRKVMMSQDEFEPDTIAEAILAFIIYCIDNQEFNAIAEALSDHEL